MKIGLISINMHTKVLNFASPLHTVAFQQFLLQNGIETTVIDYKPVYYGRMDVRHPLFYYAEYPDPDPKIQSQMLKKWKRLFYEREARFDKFQEFIDKHYIKTDKVYNWESLDKEDPDFDCYICVTDVIWNRNKVNGFDKGLWLASKCMEGKKKIAYSPSRGSSSYSNEDAKEALQYLADFDYLSAREKSFQTYLEDLTGLSILMVLDPVFLQEPSFYEALAKEPEHKPEKPYVLTYLVMMKNSRLVRKASLFAESKGLDLIELGEDLENEHLDGVMPHKVVYDIGVEEWLWYILHAEYIFTNSFHECVLAIILHKQFFAGKRFGDKIDTVLDLFDLQGRRIADDELDTSLSIPDIDFGPVDERRQELVQQSKDYILNAIHDLENRDHQPLISPEELSQREHALDAKIEEVQEIAEQLKIDAEHEQTVKIQEALEEWNRIKWTPKIVKLRIKYKLRKALEDEPPVPEELRLLVGIVFEQQAAAKTKGDDPEREEDDDA